jgi:hypothetical protein
MDNDDRIKSPKSKTSHGSWMHDRNQTSADHKNKTLRNLTLFLPKLLKEVGKTAASALAQGVESARSLKSPSRERVLQCINDVIADDSSSDSEGHVTDRSQLAARQTKRKSFRHRSTSLADVGRVKINIRMDSPKTSHHMSRKNRQSPRKGSLSSNSGRSLNVSITRFKVVIVERRARSRLLQNNLICNPLFFASYPSIKSRKAIRRRGTIFRTHSDAECAYQTINRESFEERQRRNTMDHKTERRHRTNSSKKWSPKPSSPKTEVREQLQTLSQPNSFRTFEQLFLHTSVDEDENSLLSSSSLSIPPHLSSNANGHQTHSLLHKEEHKQTKNKTETSKQQNVRSRLQLQRGSKSSSNLNVLSLSVPTAPSPHRTNSMRKLTSDETEVNNSADVSTNGISFNFHSPRSTSTTADIPKLPQTSEKKCVSISNNEFANFSDAKTGKIIEAQGDNNGAKNDRNIRETSIPVIVLQSVSPLPKTKTTTTEYSKRKPKTFSTRDNETSSCTTLQQRHEETKKSNTNSNSDVDNSKHQTESDMMPEEITSEHKKRVDSNSSKGGDFYVVGRSTYSKLSVKANSLGPSEWNQFMEGVLEKKETFKVKKIRGYSPRRSNPSQTASLRKDDTDLSSSNNTYSPRSTDSGREPSKVTVEVLDSSSNDTVSHKPSPVVEML